MSVTAGVKDIPPAIAVLRDRKIKLQQLPVKLTPQQLEWQNLSHQFPELNESLAAQLRLARRIWESMFVRIDFDKDPDGNSIPDGTKLDVQNNYKSLGVTFSGISRFGNPDPDLHVWAMSDPIDSTSQPNIVTINHDLFGDNGYWGKIRVSFDVPRTTVSIRARASNPTGEGGPGPYLAAFDSQGNCFADDRFPPDQIPKTTDTISPPFTLSVSVPAGPGNISYVEFSCTAVMDIPIFGFFDSLVVSRF